MKRRILIFSTICFLLISCAPQKKVVSGGNQERTFYCSNYYNRYNQEREVQRTYRPESRIGLDMVIKNSDTLDIAELSCVDSIEFTKALNSIEIHQMCIEMGIQGKTYFLARTNKYGGFEEVEVVRSVDHCLSNIEEKIKQKVLSMRIIPEDAGTYEIVFFHMLRLH